MRHHAFRVRAVGRFLVPVRFWLALALLTGWLAPLQAQWVTQNNVLKPGWNAVYLHVDASHTNINSLIGALDPIDEVWLWNQDLPPGLSLATPPDPAAGVGSQWSKWTKLEGINSALQVLPGNAALLVKASAAAPWTWSVKGRAVPPRYRWTLTGLNFVGFPTASPTPNFEAFLGADAQLLDWKSTAAAEIFRYQGGNLGTTNPIQVTGILQRHPTLGLVNREQAYWIRTGEPTNQIYNHYFGPFQVTGSDFSDLRFGDSLGQARLLLKNQSKSNLTVTLRLVNSEAPPGGTVPNSLPLMLRGPISTTNLTFSFADLTTTNNSWSLAPSGQVGSEVEIVLGVDRSRMVATPGVQYGGILRFTDSLGLTRVDIGASATTASRAGLWVGNAVVDQVSQYLKQYVKATNATDFHTKLIERSLTVAINNPSGTNPLNWAVSPDGRVRYEWDANSGLVLVFGTNAATGKFGTGTYLQKGDILTNLTTVPRPVPLRLIVHHDGTTTRLMQRAYLGRNSESNQVVAARQAPIAGDLANARRLSAVHLPTSDATTPTTNPWQFNGAMQQGSSLVTTVDLRHDDHASNPFLHTYHPDHDGIDNRDDTFQARLLSGKESYDVRRVMTLSFTAPGNDFDSRTRGGTRLEGNYLETISYRTNLNAGTPLREFNVLGFFSLTRISDTAEYAP